MGQYVQFWVWTHTSLDNLGSEVKTEKKEVESEAQAVQKEEKPEGVSSQCFQKKWWARSHAAEEQGEKRIN